MINFEAPDQTTAQDKAPLLDPLPENSTDFSISGEITKATNLKKENVYYYLTVHIIDQPMSCYRLEAEEGNSRSEDPRLVSQYAKGRRKMTRDQGINADFMMPLSFGFKELRNAEDIRKRVSVKEANSLNEDPKNEAFGGSKGSKVLTDKENISEHLENSQADHKNQKQNNREIQENHPEKLLAPIDRLGASPEPINNRRVSLLFELFSIDHQTIINSVGFGRLFIDPRPGSRQHRIPLFTYKKGFWQSVRAGLIGEMMEISDKQEFMNEDSLRLMDQRVLHVGDLGVNLNVMVRERQVQVVEQQRQTEQKMRKMFVKHRVFK